MNLRLVNDTVIVLVLAIFCCPPLPAAETEPNPEFQSGFGDVPQFGGPDGVSGQLREGDRAREIWPEKTAIR